MSPIHPVAAELIRNLRDSAPGLAALAERRIESDREDRRRGRNAEGMGFEATDFRTVEEGLRALDMVQKAVGSRLDREIAIVKALTDSAHAFNLGGIDLVGAEGDPTIDLTSEERTKALMLFQEALTALIDDAREILNGQA